MNAHLPFSTERLVADIPCDPIQAKCTSKLFIHQGTNYNYLQHEVISLKILFVFIGGFYRECRSSLLVLCQHNNESVYRDGTLWYRRVHHDEATCTYKNEL